LMDSLGTKSLLIGYGTGWFLGFIFCLHYLRKVFAVKIKRGNAKLILTSIVFIGSVILLFRTNIYTGILCVLFLSIWFVTNVSMFEINRAKDILQKWLR
jgi:hypothetical protein